ncbi:kinase-like domain-containing protein [Gigaspora rosea]|uniref:Kinase-like domain-containing protein n=1 Tax=Gigaspora rosea TaxID=44941 RepID=A0A397V9S3_9GLOM|nr:kinase-like domain-containing protein [Gigaspora rosea]
MLVLQYANSDTLRKYLRVKQNNGLYKILWVELTQIAKDIASGLEYLHMKNIIHRDLHSKNILTHDDKALIADFGLPKELNDPTCLRDVMAYTDPHYLLSGGSFKQNEKSDIYGLGVLLWELTSGIPPYYNLSSFAIKIEISKNNREKIIDNTPTDYSNLYEKCWSSDQNQRPKIDEILTELERLSTEISLEFIMNRIESMQSEINSCTLSTPVVPFQIE